MAGVKPIPDGYHTVTPYLTVQGVAQLIDSLNAYSLREEERHVRSKLARQIV